MFDEVNYIFYLHQSEPMKANLFITKLNIRNFLIFLKNLKDLFLHFKIKINPTFIPHSSFIYETAII